MKDWVIYGSVLAGILVVSSQWHDQSMAPAAPPPLTAAEVAIFAAFTPFTPGAIFSIPEVDNTMPRGTAFSVGPSGAWVTSRDALKNCPHPYLSLGGNLGIPVKIRHSADMDNYQLIVSPGGVRPLPTANASKIEIGQRAFFTGYARGQTAEATGRLIGRTLIHGDKRGQKSEIVYAWALAGHTMGINGSLKQLQGAPAVNSASEVIGITLRYKPRRGRIYSSTPENFAKIGNPPDRKPDFEHEDTITKHNYGIISDTFRRQYRVMQLSCLMS